MYYETAFGCSWRADEHWKEISMQAQIDKIPRSALHMYNTMMTANPTFSHILTVISTTTESDMIFRFATIICHIKAPKLKSCYLETRSDFNAMIPPRAMIDTHYHSGVSVIQTEQHRDIVRATLRLRVVSARRTSFQGV
jgi:hypothetical protein